jgi:hypothetical protein
MDPTSEHVIKTGNVCQFRSKHNMFDEHTMFRYYKNKTLYSIKKWTTLFRL